MSDRAFAPDWLTRGIGIDFEFMKNTFLVSQKINFNLPDEKNGNTVIEDCNKELVYIDLLK